eukprot:636704-Prymnesium_polylepis.1
MEESRIARQKIFASCPSVWLIDDSPSVSSSSRFFGAPGVDSDSVSGAPQTQTPFVCACTDDPMPKPAFWPASWLRMYDFPVRYSPATAHTPIEPSSLESAARASSETTSVFESGSTWMKGSGFPSEKECAAPTVGPDTSGSGSGSGSGSTLVSSSTRVLSVDHLALMSLTKLLMKLPPSAMEWRCDGGVGRAIFRGRACAVHRGKGTELLSTGHCPRGTDKHRTRTRQDIAPNAMGAADVCASACAVLVCGAGRAHLGVEGGQCAGGAHIPLAAPLMRSDEAPSRRIAPNTRFAPPS